MSLSKTSQVNNSADVDAAEEKTRSWPVKQLVAGGIFLVLGLVIAQVVPSIEIAWVSDILLLTIYLFAFEMVGVDVAAATIMVLLGLTGLFAPVMGLSEGLVSKRPV